MNLAETERAKKEISKIVNKLNATTACFSGHRIYKLPWKQEEDTRCRVMKKTLREEIIKAIERGYNTFLCGMALGFDTICAETILSLKAEYPTIKLIGVLPCKTQDAKWAKKDKERYRSVLKRLDGIRCLYDEYIGVECILERNRYMINNSSLLIALFNGHSGGTKLTIQYAEQQGLEIVIIEP